MAGLVCFFSARAFLILAIITVKIIYLGFLASCANRVALIMWISKVLSELRLFLVSYIVSYLGLGLVLGTESVSDLGLGSVLGTELVLDLDLGSLSILFIVEY